MTSPDLSADARAGGVSSGFKGDATVWVLSIG
jgi:hypothetical protein